MRKMAYQEENFDEKQVRARAKATKKAGTLTASCCLLLKHMFDTATETGPDWVKELEEDIRQECDDKYGKVVHTSIDLDTVGDVYIAFAVLSGSDQALKYLTNQWFGGRQITADPLVEAVNKTSFFKISG